ncbi:MAG: peptidoglycan DD-metalloendopeptidase family protein [Deltaproteobacteria bacterium]|nr:peptidoglycan DD-metalloendopeptidase family protein [Deltaproteobacteria bacterium]
MIALLVVLSVAAPVADKVQDSGDAIKELKQEERDVLDTLDRVIDERRSLERKARGANHELAELNRTLANEEKKLADEEKAVARALIDARARLRQLDKLLRGQALRFVVGAESFADGVRRSRIVERGFRRDAQMVDRATRIFEARQQKARELDRKRQQQKSMLAAIDEMKRSIAEKSVELQATLLAVRQKRSLEERAYYDLREFEATLQRESEEDVIALADPFAKKRGELAWPIDRRFLRADADARAVHFAPPPGTDVRAIASGSVAYAGELDGYRALVIVKHSENYYGVYAGLGAAVVKAGDSVAAHARLGAATGDVVFELRRRTVVTPSEEVITWLAH